MEDVPLPSDYTAAFKKEPKGKKKRKNKTKGKSKTKSKTKRKTKGKVETETASSSAGSIVLKAADLEVDIASWVEPYIGDSSASTRKRVYSASHHKVRKLMLAAGRCDADAKLAAAEAANAAVTRWCSILASR